MKPLARGVATMSISLALLGAGVVAAPALAQSADAQALSTERARASYTVGHDVANSLAPAAPDIDLAAFERAIRNAFDGGEPLIAADDVQATGRALMLRVASRAGQAPADAEIPDVDSTRVGYLVGADVGRSLAPISSHLDLPVLMQAVRTTFAGDKLLLDAATLDATRQAFGQKIQAEAMTRANAAGEENRAEGEAFLAANRQKKGVFTTGSGLQYSVIRQGSGPRPTPGDRVRVHYEGRLLDGTVFDSSYERGEPTEFGLNQVIAGWTEGLGLMPVGAKYRFWIPSSLAYGRKGAGADIGPNETLEFDVELQAILP